MKNILNSEIKTVLFEKIVNL